MGWRFRKSIRFPLGIRINLGKDGITSVSMGSTLYRKTVNLKSGRITNSVGIPGLGTSYVWYDKAPQIANRNYLEVEKVVKEYDSYILFLQSIHKPVYYNYFDWDAIKDEPAPFEPPEIGPQEKLAQYKYDHYKPNFLERIWGAEAKKKKLKNAIRVAHENDMESYNEWKGINELAVEVLAGNTDAYTEMFKRYRVEDIIELIPSIRFGFENSEVMELEINADLQKVVPTFKFNISSTGRVTSREMPKSQYNTLALEYVSSLAIRIARDAFQILPITHILVHVMDTRVDGATGNAGQVDILSVDFKREIFEQTNFDNVIPSQMMGRFERNINFGKLKGLAAVKRLEANAL